MNNNPADLAIVTVEVPTLVIVKVRSFADKRTMHEHPVTFTIHFSLATLNPTVPNVSFILKDGKSLFKVISRSGVAVNSVF